MFPRALALLVLSLAACDRPVEGLTIGEVVADPARFEDRTIELSGTATESVGIFSTGMYKLSDESGEIWVMTTAGLPSDDSTFTVRGTVLTGFTLGGKRYATVLNEQQREY